MTGEQILIQRGEAEGKAEGKAEGILRVLETRKLVVGEARAVASWRASICSSSTAGSSAR